MIPKKLRDAAMKVKANVGREYDSNGNHIAYYLRVSDNWRVYRHSVSGMLALLRSMTNNQLEE